MIEATIDLMRTYGLSGSGIKDVVRESAAPRGSVYHFFPQGKNQIVAESLAVHADRVSAFMEAALCSKRAAPQKVTALFEAFARRVEEAMFQKSCAFGAVTLDLGPEDESLRLVIASAFESWRAGVARHFEALGRQQAQSFAGMILTAIEGAYIRARAERTGRPFREAGEWLARAVRPAG
jgi:TetR/AcrR family transcriptional repressor of lmrAB and yxaGH operons